MSTDNLWTKKKNVQEKYQSFGGESYLPGLRAASKRGAQGVEKSPWSVLRETVAQSSAKGINRGVGKSFGLALYVGTLGKFISLPKSQIMHLTCRIH